MEEQQNYPFIPQIVQPTERENLVLQTSPERIAELMEHHLRGEIWSDEDKGWIKEVYKDKDGKTQYKRTPMMNDKGVNEVMCMVKFFMNQNATLTNLDREDISREVLGFADALIKSMAMNSKKWDLDNSIRTALAYSIISTIYNTISRSLGKTISDKELYQGTIQSRELVQIREPLEKKKGFLGSMFQSKKPNFPTG